MMESSYSYQYEEYNEEDHRVDGSEENETDEPGRMAGFIDHIKTLESDIRAKLTSSEDDDNNDSQPAEENEEEDKSLFEKLTGFEIPSPFSQSEDTNGSTPEPKKEEKRTEGSFFERVTRFDGHKEKGYNVKSSTTHDEAELKDAPKVSNMIALFEQMKAKTSQVMTSSNQGIAENEIEAEKKRARENNTQDSQVHKKEEPGLLDKLASSLPFSDDKEKEPEPVEDEENEENKSFMERLTGFSFDADSSQKESADTYEVDEVSEPSILDQVATSIKNTFISESADDQVTMEKTSSDEEEYI